jgi:glycosyltransferase involved in cell wall biosynthesis
VTKTDLPLVSIVTPTYNMADRLPQCVESVASQTYPHIQHVVVDGASTDGTKDYLASQAHLKWISEPDEGQSDALNKGFAMADGEIVTWLNADDVLLPHAVAKVVDAFRTNPSAGWVYGNLEVRRGDERWVTKAPPRITNTTFQRGNVVSQPGTFFTAATLEQVGGIDADFHLTMDFELWLRFVAAGIPSVYVPMPLAAFEVHLGSKTGSQGALAFAMEEFRALLKHGQPHAAAMAIDRWYWDETLTRLVELLTAHRYGEARTLAREAVAHLHPVAGRARLFLWAAVLSPVLAGRLTRLKRNRRM